MGLLDLVVQSIAQNPDLLDDIAANLNQIDNEDIAANAEAIDEIIEAGIRRDIGTDEEVELMGQILADIEPFGEAANVLVDAAEEGIISDVQEAGQLTPENVESLADDLEGNATALLLGIAGTAILLEFVTAGQLEGQTEWLVQALAGLGLGDVTGRELDARMQEGIDPALKQLVHSEHRSKQADFKDYSEANARLRLFDGEMEPRSGDIPDDVRRLFNPEDFDWMPDPDTYGTIPDQTGLFEFVALEELEPEEIIEEGPQKGLIPSRAAMLQVLRSSTLPKDVQQVYLDLHEQLPKSADMIQESIRLEEPLRTIDEAVFNNQMTPRQAVAMIERDVRSYLTVSSAGGETDEEGFSEREMENIVLRELFARFQLLASVPSDVPTRGQFTRWYRNGTIDSQGLFELNERFGQQQEFFAEILIDNTIRQGGDNIAQQFVLDRISGTEAKFRLGLIGYNSQEASRILAGADPDDIINERFAERGDESELPVTLAIEIGDARGAVLNQVGINSLSKLAAASVEDLTSVTGMSDSEAERAISSAQRILSGDGGEA